MYMYTCTRTHWTYEVEDVYPEQQGGGAVVAEQRRRLCCLWNGAETVQCSGVEGACVCVCVSLATPTSMEREGVIWLLSRWNVINTCHYVPGWQGNKLCIDYFAIMWQNTAIWLGLTVRCPDIAGASHCRKCNPALFWSMRSNTLMKWIPQI